MKIPVLRCWGCTTIPPAPAAEGTWAGGYQRVVSRAQKWGILWKRDGRERGASDEPSLVLHQLNSAAEQPLGGGFPCGTRAEGQREEFPEARLRPPRSPGGARSLPGSALAGGGGAGAGGRKGSFDGNENVRF